MITRTTKTKEVALYADSGPWLDGEGAFDFGLWSILIVSKEARTLSCPTFFYSFLSNEHIYLLIIIIADTLYSDLPYIK